MLIYDKINGIQRILAFNLNKMIIDDFKKIDWLLPWYVTLSGLEQELGREVSFEHPVYQVQVLAVVHLTWRHEINSKWPRTRFYESIQDFIDRQMKMDAFDNNISI